MKASTLISVLAALAVPATAAPLWVREDAGKGMPPSNGSGESMPSANSDGEGMPPSDPSTTPGAPSPTETPAVSTNATLSTLPLPTTSDDANSNVLCAEDYVFGKLVCEQLKWTPIGRCCTVPGAQSGPLVSASNSSFPASSPADTVTTPVPNPSDVPEPTMTLHDVAGSPTESPALSDVETPAESPGKSPVESPADSTAPTASAADAASPTDAGALAAQVDQGLGNTHIGVESNSDAALTPPDSNQQQGGSSQDGSWCWGTGCDANGNWKGNKGSSGSKGNDAGAGATTNNVGNQNNGADNGVSKSVSPPGNPDLPFASDTTEITAEMTVADKDGSSQISKMILDYHNQFRASYGAPALTWDAQMGNNAAGYAGSCVREHHGPSNIHWATNMFSVHSMMDGWAEEAKDYTGGESSPATGHFTQMVWKSATKLGCGWKLGCDGQSTGDGKVLFYCQYDVGNMAGEYADNVGSKQ